MAFYEAFHCTTRGYSHVLRETVCEDYSLSLEEENIRIAVVCDGHGDSACFRSHIGSRIAAELAQQQLRAFACNIRQQGWEDRLFDPVDAERLLRQLIRSIMGNWTLKIMEQLEQEPVSEQEYAQSRDYAPLYRQGRELPHIFGCTLIAALITDRYMLVLHQGDGRCVVLHADGTADQPVPWDDRCVGNICTSMCHSDAVESCRYYVADLTKDPVAGCFVTTDGIEDSLEDLEALNAFFCDIGSRYVKQGKQALLQQLETELPRMSQLGSADDTSLAAIVDPQRLVLLADRLECIHALQICGTEERKARNKLNSMQRKMEYLKNELEQAQTAYDTAHAELYGTNQLLANIRKQLQQLLQKQTDTENQVQIAAQKLQAAKEAYGEYRQTHDQFAQKEHDAQNRAAELRQQLDAMDIPPIPVAETPSAQEPDWEITEPIQWDSETPEAFAPQQDDAWDILQQTPDASAFTEVQPEEQEQPPEAQAPVTQGDTEFAQEDRELAQEEDTQDVPSKDFIKRIIDRITGKNSK